MSIYSFKITLASLFGNIYRGKHVLIAPIDSDNKIILGSKPKFYPPQIYRLIGGGIEGNESLETAIYREAKEELNLAIDSKKLGLPIEISFEVTCQKKNYLFITYLFIYYLSRQDVIRPGSDIAGIVKMTKPELKQLINRYYALPKDSWYKDAKTSYAHRWSDYGKVYGKIHEVLYQELMHTQ